MGGSVETQLLRQSSGLDQRGERCPAKPEPPAFLEDAMMLAAAVNTCRKWPGRVHEAGERKSPCGDTTEQLRPASVFRAAAWKDTQARDGRDPHRPLCRG